ncbi:MAG: EVE domain-containing protein [Cytophagaceae bacterium]|nr:EVE domain-containing protein [Gemmatimonadaceae bacterium]
MQYWLMKTEPATFSFDDLMKAPKRTTSWDGVRNYQARNFMQQMKVGDQVIIYHSSAEPPGAAGIAEVAGEAHPDLTAFDAKDDHYDPGSTRDAPRWFVVDVRGVEKLERLVALEELRGNPALADMRLLQRGNRLSVLPVTAAEFREVRAMAKRKPR